MMAAYLGLGVSKHIFPLIRVTGHGMNQSFAPLLQLRRGIVNSVDISGLPIRWKTEKKTVRLPMACDRLDSDTSHPRMKSSTDLRAFNFTRACFFDLWGVSKIGVDIYAPVHSPC